MDSSIARRFGTGSAPGNARHTGHVCVFGSPPEAVRAAAEHLRARLQLHVDLQPDHRLPGHHRSRSGTTSKPIARSSAWPARNSVFSANCGPISCKPDRQALRQAARDGQARQPGHARRDRQQVVQVHRERVGDLRAELERDRRARRRDDHVEPLEQLVVLALDHRAHLLRLPVVRVVVAGRERVRADHDAALRLVAEDRRRACSSPSRGSRRRDARSP